MKGDKLKEYIEYNTNYSNFDDEALEDLQDLLDEIKKLKKDSLLHGLVVEKRRKANAELLEKVGSNV